MNYMIGIDAGGTHTTAIAYDENGKKITSAETGQGNIIIDYDGGITNIVTAVQRIATEIGNDPQKVLVGIAGISIYGHEPEVAREISARINNVPTKAITDAVLALYNGLEGDDGALVIAGTGSIVNGLQNGHLISVGGYGQILGDEGSAYQIAVAGMKHALRVYDEGHSDALMDMFTTYFGVERMEDCNAPFYKMTRPQVAAMAVEIAKLADDGDPAATAVIKDQAHMLAEDILICLNRYQDPKPMKIALTGSVLANNEMLRKQIEDDVHAKYPKATFSVSNGQNARGVIFDKSTDYVM